MTTPKISDIIGIINKIAPFALAEEWDNVGLQVGDPAAPAGRIMVALDPLPEAVDAAISAKCSLLLTHHPLLFRPLKKISLSDPHSALIARAIRNDLAVVSLHTNYDIAPGGLNDLLAERLDVLDCVPLKETGGEELVKLTVYVPREHVERVHDVLAPFSGFIGNYSDCSFRVMGTGTFKPLPGARPVVGTVGTREDVDEARLEVLLRRGDIGAAVNAMLKAHPYEEPAFDLYPLLNRGEARGLGRVGRLAAPLALREFASIVKDRLAQPAVRVVGDLGRQVKKIALCGGSGASLVKNACFKGADVLVTGDIKYHEAREAEAAGLALVDAGHFATEHLMVHGLVQRLEMELAYRGLDALVIACEGENEPFVYL